MGKKITIKWNDVKNNAPLPHYICNGSNITIEIDDDGKIQASGTCLFPKNDKTLSKRKQVNHFHSIILLTNVIFALNVVWNAARATAQVTNWEKMLSVETHTRVFHPIKIDQPYHFVALLEKMKKDFNKVTLKILDVDNKTELISVETTVIAN